MGHDAIEGDVLIIGGGWAGVFASFGARDAGASVVIAEKAPSIKRSGGLGPGIADISLPIHPDGTTDETLINHYIADNLRYSEYMADPEVSETLARGGQRMLHYLEDIGIHLVRKADGTYHMGAGKGESPERPYELWFEGANSVKPRLAQSVRSRGVRTIETCAITALLVDGDRTVGAVGVDTRTGETRVFKAKAVIIVTGPGHRMYSSRNGIYWNSWNCPYNTYDGHVVAYRAGAELAGLEFTAATMFLKDFGSPGMNPWLNNGGQLVNSKGERIIPKYADVMPTYDTATRQPTRSQLVWAICKEIEAGNGPIFLDFRHAPEENIRALHNVLHEERPSLNLYFESRGLDYRKDLIEIEVSQRYGHQGGCSGIIIDGACRTNLPGLFSAGDVTASQGAGLGAAPCAAGVVVGYEAGQKAAQFAANQRDGALDERAVVTEEARVARFRESKREPVPWLELNYRISDIMNDYVAYPRSGAGLQTAIKRLNKLAPAVEQLQARDSRELIRCLETENLMTMALLTATAALTREESRLGTEHYRTDYPERDDRNWIKYVVVKQGTNGAVDVSTRPIGRSYEAYLELEGIS